MRLSLRLLAGIGTCLLTLGPAPAMGQEEVQNPPDPWVHAGTGTSFPAALAEFRRGRVIEYSEDGRDASVGYHYGRGDDRLTVTLYVYPVIEGWNCQETFNDAKSSVAHYDGAWLIGERREIAPSGTGDRVAYFARYSIPAGAMGENFPEVWSEVYLYCPPGGEWLVKYRATWDADVDFSERVEALLRAIEWPDDLDG